MYNHLTNHEEFLATTVVDIAFKIHKELGPGLLESIYERCFCYELIQRNIPFEQQKSVAIIFENLVIEDGLRLDLLIDNQLIIELKAQENYHPVWSAQLLSYLKLTRNRIGFVMNFNVPLIKDGIKRMVLG